jgi:hypothetical protein
MPPHHVPCTLPLVYLPLSLVARMTRLALPSRNTCWRSSRYCPMFSGLSQNTGFLIVSRAFGQWAAARPAVELDSPVRQGGPAQRRPSER